MRLTSKPAIAVLLSIVSLGSASPGFAADTASSAPPASQTAYKVAAAGTPAPNFTGLDRWFNSAPLSVAGLRGKVVLVNFWTYGCYNCVNTLPHVVSLYNKYKDKGLVVVGIHTPEFPFEKSASNVQAALKRHGITYPVAQDNESATWNAYNNHYWPAQYIIDQNGTVVFTHAGEGQYDEIERTVRSLLKADS